MNKTQIVTAPCDSMCVCVYIYNYMYNYIYNTILNTRPFKVYFWNKHDSTFRIFRELRLSWYGRIKVWFQEKFKRNAEQVKNRYQMRYEIIFSSLLSIKDSITLLLS